VLAVIYRPGSEAVSGAFFDEVAHLIEILSSQSCPVVLTGDDNVRLDRDWARLTDLLDSFGLAQHVHSPTQTKGGILDIVVTRTDILRGRCALKMSVYQITAWWDDRSL